MIFWYWVLYRLEQPYVYVNDYRLFVALNERRRNSKKYVYKNKRALPYLIWRALPQTPGLRSLWVFKYFIQRKCWRLRFEYESLVHQSHYLAKEIQTMRDRNRLYKKEIDQLFKREQP